MTPVDQLLDYARNYSVEIGAKYPFISVYGYMISNYAKKKSIIYKIGLLVAIIRAWNKHVLTCI